MSDQGTGSGWKPLSRPDLSRPGQGAQPGDGPHVQPSDVGRRLSKTGAPIVSPFSQLARTHAFHAAGEASVFVTLAGTLLTIDPNDARSRIFFALVLTMAPFALVGPLIGPALDRIRGGRRATIPASLILRAGLMILLSRNLDTAWFFPIAFIWLVMGKTYSVAKAATVPTTVDSDDELVRNNSRLAILSAVAGVVGVAPAAALYRLFGPTPTLWCAAIIYLVGVYFSLKLPSVMVDDPETTDDDLDIRSAGVRMASFVMATIRGIVGFVFFVLVFEFVRSELPDLSGIGTAAGAAVKYALGFELVEDPGLPWYKAAIPFALWGLGGFLGNVIAPRLPRRFTEENILAGSVAAIGLAAVAAIWAGGLSGAALVALVVGTAASAAKLAFDSLVQRDAPGANHGAAFGRFETTFQIAWVVGSLIAVIGSEFIALRVSFLIIAIAAIAIGVFLLRGGAQLGPLNGAATGIGERFRGSHNADEQPPDHPGHVEQPAAQPVMAVQPAVPQQAAPFDIDPRPTTTVAAQGAPAAPMPPPQQLPQAPQAPQSPPMPPTPSYLAPPDWLNEGSQPARVEPNPTPPMGTDPVD